MKVLIAATTAIISFNNDRLVGRRGHGNVSDRDAGGAAVSSRLRMLYSPI